MNSGGRYVHIDSVVRLCQYSRHDTTVAVTKLKHAVHTLYSSFYVAALCVQKVYNTSYSVTQKFVTITNTHKYSNYGSMVQDYSRTKFMGVVLALTCRIGPQRSRIIITRLSPDFTESTV